jgi:hypothetical protein
MANGQFSVVDAEGKPSVGDLLAGLELVDPERGRTIIHPEDGVFDLVVSQSALSELVTNADGIMKGRPTETVYLEVGTSKAWILQYCGSGDDRRTEESTSPGWVYFLVDFPQPMIGPYPSITVRPPAPLLPRKEYVLVHGLITTEGVFDKLEVLKTRSRDLLSMLEPSLKKWRFRPASRQGEPLPVEILLLIPPIEI